MASKATYTAVAVLGIAVASGAAWWLQRPSSSAAKEPAPAPSAQGPQPAASAARAGSGPALPVTVEVAPVRQMALNDDAEAVGSLRSRQSVVLRPEVGGRVTELNFKDGQRVRRGQVLARLDDQLPRAQVQQGEAELSIANANHKRNQELVAQGFISQRSLDESAANLQVAGAKLALAQATAARHTIVAPFDGIAGIRSVAVGDYLKDGADIVNIEDLDAVYVDFRLPERFQHKLRPGQVARVEVDALPGVRYEAVVQAINPQLDADGRSVAVRACIDNRRLQLRPGMFARVTAVFGERADARVVPEEAVVPKGDRPYVYKIEPGTEAGTQVARRVDVKLGARRPGLVEVLEGLAPGDTVVVAGQQRIARDGAAVKVVALGAGEGAAPAAPAARPALLVQALPGSNPCMAALPAAATARHGA